MPFLALSPLRRSRRWSRVTEAVAHLRQLLPSQPNATYSRRRTVRPRLVYRPRGPFARRRITSVRCAATPGSVPTSFQTCRPRTAFRLVPASPAADVESAYKLGITKGAGQTVAIVDAFGYTQAASDLAAYRSGNGLPACTTKTGCLAILNQKGQKKPLPKPNPGDDWRPEQALDLDAVSAACPKCHIVLVRQPPTSTAISAVEQPRPITRTSSRTRSAVPKTAAQPTRRMTTGIR